MSTTSSPNPFHVLGLRSRDRPTKQQISAAYRKLALQIHPDKSTDPLAKEKFQALSKSHELAKSLVDVLAACDAKLEREVVLAKYKADVAAARREEKYKAKREKKKNARKVRLEIQKQQEQACWDEIRQIILEGEAGMTDAGKKHWREFWAYMKKDYFENKVNEFSQADRADWVAKMQAEAQIAADRAFREYVQSGEGMRDGRAEFVRSYAEGYGAVKQPEYKRSRDEKEVDGREKRMRLN